MGAYAFYTHTHTECSCNLFVICGGLLSDLLAWPRADEIIAPQTEPRERSLMESLLGLTGNPRGMRRPHQDPTLSLFKQTTFDKTHTPPPQSRQLFFPASFFVRALFIKKQLFCVILSLVIRKNLARTCLFLISLAHFLGRGEKIDAHRVSLSVT